jgi:hypothetical protein
MYQLSAAQNEVGLLPGASALTQTERLPAGLIQLSRRNM